MATTMGYRAPGLPRRETGTQALGTPSCAPTLFKAEHCILLRNGRRAAPGGDANADEHEGAPRHHHHHVPGLACTAVDGVCHAGTHLVCRAGDGILAIQALEENADTGNDENDSEDGFHE